MNIVLTITAFLPIILLIVLMTKKHSMPSYKALPLVALLTYLLMLILFQRQSDLLHATVLNGFLSSWTPILIIWGAVFLFRTMEATGSMGTIRTWLNGISDNKIAQLMIVGWAFPFLIEGASGFGTPAALAAPVLIGLGFPVVRVAIMTLIMNSVPVSFGAVGTPTWYGFSTLNLSDLEIFEIGVKSSVVHGVAALVIPLIAIAFLISWKDIKKNLVFIYGSILATVVPYVLIAQFSYEFPALAGGMIGLIVSVVLAKFSFGLQKEGGAEIEVKGLKEKISTIEIETVLHHEENDAGATNVIASDKVTVKTGELTKASFPLWGTVLILIITRIPQLGIKGLLNADDPQLQLALGTLGDFTFSPALVVGLKNIFGTSVGWSHKILYVPSLIPFALVVMITFFIYKSPFKDVKSVWSDTYKQLKHPALALFGALVFVQLMMMGGNTSAISLIGTSLAALTGGAWKYVSSFLGALGSFFSGSNTISNLTFGGIQDSIAASSGLNRTTVLALQSVGGAMGNMVCINNIVAVCSVLGLGKAEGYILKRTVRALLVYGGMVALIAIVLP